jgi:hypothetical protein
MLSNGDFNIDIGKGGLFYPDGARASSGRQVSSYLESPSRYNINIGRVFEDCIELNKTYDAMRDCVAEFPKAPAPGPFGGFLVVFGIGLGFHVQELVRKINFKTLIIIEPNDELIAHSMHVVDWKDLFGRMERDGREAKLLRGPSWAAKLTEIVRGDYYSLLSGSYLYLHVQMPAFIEFHKRLFNPKSNEWVMVSGWVEDQLTLLRNSQANFLGTGVYLQTAKVMSTRVMPAFIVGAGPSLDGDIEDIRRCRNDVVLISASSALKVLLENGITPDIHCELENEAFLGVLVERLSARFDLSGIVLYASCTVDPRLSLHYKDTIYFFRGALSSTELFGCGAETTRNSDPTSGNTAVHCAMSLGFKDVYLFGLDFGARDSEHHHSRHSVYYSGDIQLPTNSPYDFDRSVPGNFGGEVMTGWVLDWGHNSVTASVKATPNARVRNCSDGVLIAGTIPQAAEAIDIPPSPVGQRQDIEQALAELYFCGEPRANAETFARLGRTLRTYLDRCVEIVAASDHGGQSPQISVATLCGGIMRELGLLAADPVGRAARLTVLGHTQETLAAAFNAASYLPPAHAEDGSARIFEAVSESFRRLYPLVDAVFPS